MTTQWFYVEDNDKHGPIEESVLIQMIREKKLTEGHYVWSNGLGSNWKKLYELEEFKKYFKEGEIPFDWHQVDPDEKIFFIMTGKDRNSKETLYGPYSINIIARLYKEKRINGRSYIWCSSMKNWEILADIAIFEEAFSEKPPKIEDIERRANPRKPFIARMLFHDNEKLYEGICRDISMGGMQVLVSDFPGGTGDKISFNVHPDNSNYHFVASGEIVRILDGGQGFSFRFTELTDEAKQAINNYIANE